MERIDVAPGDLSLIQRILGEHVPELEVRAFGSRVTRAARETSDLDLVLMTRIPLPAERMADLRDAFTESELPFKVDLVDWATTQESFRRIIETRFVVLHDGAGQRRG